MRMIISLVIVFLLSAGIVVTGKNYLNKKDAEYELKKEQVLSKIPGIVCYGDSLTAGASSEYGAYPSFMGSLIEEKLGVEIPVINMGVGGENSINVVGRSGCIPFTLKAFTIPSDSTPVRVEFEPINDWEVRIGANGNFNGVNPCVINGVLGQLSGDIGEYFFTRNENGEKVDVEAGTELVTYAKDKWKNYITIIYMGENGGYSDIQDLINQQHAIIDSMDSDNKKYLIITTTGDTKETHRELEEKMLEEYGDKYLNLRDYLCSDAIYDAKITPTSEDMTDMSEGRVPASLRADGIHYNEAGTKRVADCVYEKLLQLGYLEIN